MGNLGSRAAIVAIATALSAGCGAGRGSAPLWTFSPDGYFSERSFGQSHFSADVVLLHHRESFTGELVALDPASGAVRWRRSASWTAHPPDRLDPLWIVDDPANTDHEQLVRLDPATGAELDRVQLSRPLSSLHDRLAWAGGLILAFGYGELRAVDPSSGEDVWTIAVDRDAYLWAPVVRGRTVLLLGPTYVAIDARTGGELWRVEGTCCTALASPDGRELYVRSAVGRAARLDWRGAPRGQLAGEVRAVSDRYVGVQEASRLAVYRHGAARPEWTKPTSDHDFVSAVALAGSDLFFFDNRDTTLWWRDLAGGRSRAIREVHGRFVVGTEKGQTGMSPSYLGTPPVYAPPYLFLLDWGIEAYRIDR